MPREGEGEVNGIFADPLNEPSLSGETWLWRMNEPVFATRRQILPDRPIASGIRRL